MRAQPVGKWLSLPEAGPNGGDLLLFLQHPPSLWPLDAEVIALVDDRLFYARITSDGSLVTDSDRLAVGPDDAVIAAVVVKRYECLPSHPQPIELTDLIIADDCPT